jgi:hypothetical protein
MWSGVTAATNRGTIEQISITKYAMSFGLIDNNRFHFFKLICVLIEFNSSSEIDSTDQWSSTGGTRTSRGARKYLMGYAKLKEKYYFMINTE